MEHCEGVQEDSYMKCRNNYTNKQKYLDDVIQSENLPEDVDLLKMYRLAGDKNPCIRWSVAKALVRRYVPESETVLRSMTYDKNSLVRINAIDSLGIGRQKETLQRLKELIRNQTGKQESGYAVMSYFDVWVNRYGYNRESMHGYLTDIREFYEKENRSWVLINYERNRYLAGERDAIEKMIDLIKNAGQEETDVFPAVISTINEIMSLSSKENIKNALSMVSPSILESCPDKVRIDQYSLQILFLDRDNTGTSQLLEFIGDSLDTDFVFSSAGLEPGKRINENLSQLIKRKTKTDITGFQYPKPVMHLYWYDFIVPVGQKLNPEDYPFQTIIPVLEEVDENIWDWDQGERMVKDVCSYIHSKPDRCLQRDKHSS